MITAPTVQELFDAAEHGRGGTWLDRALAIAALTGVDGSGLAGEPVGRLQEAALDVHESLGTTVITATTTCPVCAAAVEFDLGLPMLREQRRATTSGSLHLGARSARWRVPTVEDLSRAVESADPVGTMRERCISATVGGQDVDGAALPEAMLNEIERAMAQADPLADVVIALRCPECDTDVDTDLDPIGFVWTEIEARTGRLLREVDELARAYGWTESEILSLPASRRAAYVRMVRGEAP